MKNSIFLIGLCGLLVACDDASIASRNVSKAADNFEITRRIVFFNGITNDYLLEIVGKCSLKDEVHQLEVVCKDAADGLQKHFLGLSDNVSYFSEQIGIADASLFHTRITFKPQAIIPDIDFRGSTEDLPQTQ